MGASIEINHITVVRDGRTILDVPQLDVAPGQVVAVIGANGAGKSTLLKVLAHLIQPTAGQVQYKGKSLTNGISQLLARREMATVFQDSLLLTGNALFNVAIPCILRGDSKKAAYEKARYWLMRMGIEHLAKQPVKGLSGGEAQRVSLARAFAVEPQILFLDEPFTSLDAPTKVLLMDELELLIKSSGVTAIFVTHDLEGIPFYANRVLVMNGGLITHDDSIRNLIQNPSSPFLKAFFRNILSAVGTQHLEESKLS